MELTRGANAAVAAPAVSLVLEWNSDRGLDPQALLLADTGKIRSNADFVFFNAPAHPSGTVALSEVTARRATLRLTLADIEATVDRVVIAGSVDEGSFGDIEGLILTVRHPGGRLLRYAVRGTGRETAMVLGEFYRRNGEWKFRAVGQGWDSGLRGLAEQFGVEVDDEPESTPEPEPTPPPLTRSAPPAASARSASPTPAPTPQASPTPAPTRSAASAPAAPEPAPTQPAPTQPAPAPASEPAAARRLAPTLPAQPRVPVPDMPAAWYAVPADPSRLRWWNGSGWTGEYRPAHPANDPATCPRCGRPRHVQRFGPPSACRWCESEVGRILESWRERVWQVLATTGPSGPAWDELWILLRHDLISEGTGREALRPLALAHLERVVAFAFADGEIEQDELADFERTIEILRASTDLSAAHRHIEGLRRRMLRGRGLTQVKVGDLPHIERPDLHLESDELLYLDVNGTRIKYLANGPKHFPGRLIGSSKKLRFVGQGAGAELSWAKIVSVRHEYDTVVIEATTTRGGGTYHVPDAEYVAAVLEGALRVAKRLVLAPGRRDTRAVPQDVKSRVWQRDGGKCVQCGDKQYLEFDHIIPWSQGGATSVDNLQILCRGCNGRKGARI
ncbi:TerD family protein [Nocardia sp. NPDC005978]|uniref:TerD family protein n=1 Tax=Nocardia sp. NPDC005978 TaxID=3156725 RepID=UPI0033A4D73A